MPDFVLDASMALSWCFADEATDYSNEVQASLVDNTALVPTIWPLEVANVLVLAERRGRITEAERQHWLDYARSLPVEVITPTLEHILDVIAGLAVDQRLTVYDAAYLDLALREGLPLASLDDRLRTAAGNVGVSLV